MTATMWWLRFHFFAGWAWLEGVAKDMACLSRLMASSRRNVMLLTGLLCLGKADVTGQGHDFPSARELRMLSIEELVELKVTTATRRPEPMQTTPSAVAVITDEDIRRTGVRTIPDALRLVPGVHVARSSAWTWAVSARGFNANTANKLQVVRDGRSLYTPLYSGVFWDVQHTTLEDVERIEVVRGPGATLWGANAVNGVINIITRDARDTQGTLVSAGGGRGEEAFVAVRQGGRAGERIWYRVYANAWERDDLLFLNGQRTHERHLFGQGGFRMDGHPHHDAHWTLQGEIYDSRVDEVPRGGNAGRGGHLLARWSQSVDDVHSYSVQAYFDRNERDIPGVFHEARDVGDIEVQHRIKTAGRHDLLWGLNVRVSDDRTDMDRAVAFDPPEERVWILSGFLQDRIILVEDVLDFTIGSKFEHSTFVNRLEVQPSARLAYSPTTNHTVWTAVSRAARTPARIDRDLVFS